jgi:PAS domain S-box-containing protein
MDESTTALRTIASSPVALVFADRDGANRIWNEAASKLLGYAPEQAIGRRVGLFIPPGYHELHWAGFNRAVACGRTGSPGDAEAVGVAGLLTKAG